MSDEARKEYTLIAIEQRRYFRELAAKIQAGQPISEADRALCAAVLRAWADQIPTRPARKRGGEPQFDVGALALDFAVLVNAHDLSRTAAKHKLAEAYKVSETAIRKAIDKFGEEEALRLIPRNPSLGT